MRQRSSAITRLSVAAPWKRNRPTVYYFPNRQMQEAFSWWLIQYWLVIQWAIAGGQFKETITAKAICVYACICQRTLQIKWTHLFTGKCITRSRVIVNQVMYIFSLAKRGIFCIKKRNNIFLCNIFNKKLTKQSGKKPSNPKWFFGVNPDRHSTNVL